MFCCCDKRTAHLFIAWYSLIHFVVSIIAGSLAIYYLYSWAPFDAYMNSVTARCILALLIINAIAIIISILDIYGIEKDRPGFMMPFFTYSVLYTILMVCITGASIVLLILFLTNENVKEDQDEGEKYVKEYIGYLAASIVICAATSAYLSYSCYIVFSHIEEVKSQQVRPMNKMAESKKARRDSWESN